MGQGSSVALSCGVDLRRGSDLALLWLCRAWEPPYAAGVTLKHTHTHTHTHTHKDKKKKKNRERVKSRKLEMKKKKLQLIPQKYKGI